MCIRDSGSGVHRTGGAVVDRGGNLDVDPQFVAPEHGDYHVAFTSPVVDAGDNGAIPAGVTTDLDGEPRFVDLPAVGDTGSGTPPIVDIGAYEVQDTQCYMYLPCFPVHAAEK